MGVVGGLVVALWQRFVLNSRVDISLDGPSRSGLWKEHPLVCHSIVSVYRSLCPMSSISSAIIEHLITLRKAGLATVAYYYFDFRDIDKDRKSVV